MSNPILTAPRGGEHAERDPGATASVRWALAALSLSTLLSSLGTSIANVALPTLARHFDAPFQSVQWVVLGYLLALTVSIVGVGRVGDLVGRRRLLRIGLALFAGASTTAAIAPTLALVVAARAVQGLGAAIMTALTLALVAEVLPKGRTGSAMGLLGTTSALGTALGPSIGGLLIDQLGWRAVFFVHVPFAAAAIFLAGRHLPADRPHGSADRAGLDVPGTLLLALALGAYALALTLGRGGSGVALLVVAAGAAGLFVVVEGRVASPLVRWAMFRDPGLTAGLAANLLVSTVMMTTLIVGPFHLSLSLGLEPSRVGLVMAIGPAVAALAGVPAGRLVDRAGSARSTRVALLAVALGCLALSVVPEGAGVAGYVAPVVVVTAGYALFHAANNTAVMKEASAAERGLVSGVLSLSRNLGLVTGASAMGAVFALASGTDDVTMARPDVVAAAARVTFAVAAGLGVVALAVLAAGRALRARSA